MEQIAWADKDKTLPTSDVRRLWREEDTAELKSKFNANVAELAIALASDPNFAATVAAALALKAPLASPAFTGTVTGITSAMVGLGNATNTSDADKPVSTAQASAIAVVQNDVNTHEALTNNPHGVTKTQVGLPLADNTSDADKPVSTAQASAIAVVQNDINTHEALTSNPHSVTKTQVGLSNVDNTSDFDKPISNLTQIALNDKTTNTQFAYKVTLTGTQDGDGIPGGSGNLIFTVGEIMVAGTDQVFRNGQLQTEGENYTITGYATTPTITFALAPESWETLRINFIRP